MIQQKNKTTQSLIDSANRVLCPAVAEIVWMAEYAPHLNFDLALQRVIHRALRKQQQLPIKGEQS